LETEVAVRTVHLGPLVGLVGQFVLLGWLGNTVGLGPLGWLAGLLYGVTMNALLLCGLEHSRATGLGPANAVTLTRATLVGGVAALVVDGFVRPVPVPVRPVLVLAPAAAR